MAGPGFTSSRYTADLSQSDEFRIWHCKILPCRKRYSHDWNECVFAHAGEKIQRRCPRKYQYMGIMCPEIKKFSVCPRGETCCYAHNSFEYWLHPSRYRTEMCTYGTACSRSVCFFAHTPSQLRAPAGLTSSPNSFQAALDSPGASPTASQQPLTPTGGLFGTPSFRTPSVSPRADQAAWFPTVAATSTPTDLTAALPGLSLTRQSPLGGPPATPFTTTHYTTDTVPLPAAAATTNTYPLLIPKSTPYPFQPRDTLAIPPAALAPPSTVPSALRPALRTSLTTTPPALTLPPTPNTAPYPTLRAPPASSFPTYPSPSAVIMASTADLCRPLDQHLSLPPYTDTYPAADTNPLSDRIPICAVASDLGFDSPTAGGGAQGFPPEAEAYYAEYPTATTAMQQVSVSGLLAPVSYTDAVSTMGLAAQMASSSGLMYPYVQ